MAAKKQPRDEPSFEESMKRLEAIVKEMEDDELSLEQMMLHFEEGTTLVKSCGKTLNEVERKIEKLVKRGEDIVTEPFEPESGGASES